MVLLTQPGFNFIWNIVSGWIDAYIKAKIIMCEVGECKKVLAEFIELEVLEV